MAFAKLSTRDLAAEVRKAGEAERVRLGGGIQRAGTKIGAFAAKDLADYEKFVKNRPLGILQQMGGIDYDVPKNITGGGGGIQPTITSGRAQTVLPADYFRTIRPSLEPGTGQWMAPKQTPLAGGVVSDMPDVGGRASTRTMAELEAMRRGVTLEPRRSLLPADYFGKKVKVKPSKPKVPSLSSLGTAKVSGFVGAIKKDPNLSSFFRPKKASIESGLISQVERMKIEARENKRFLKELAKISPASEEVIAKNLMKPVQFEAWHKARTLEEARKQKKFARAWAKIMKGGNVKMLLPALLLAGLFGSIISNEQNAA